jgi:hypothetical protein
MAQENSGASARDVIAGAAGQVADDRLVAATDQVIEDASILYRACWGKRNVALCRAQGTAFEHLEVLNFNRAAARLGSPLRAIATHATDPRSRVDIRVVDEAGTTILEVQCKSRLDPTASIRDLAHDKYHGMGRLAPADHTPEIRDRLRARKDPWAPRHPGYEDVDEHLLDTLECDNVKSPGTTRSQAERAASSPKSVAVGAVTAEAAREIAVAARNGAILGGALGAGVGAISAYRTREAEALDARAIARRAAQDGAKSAARGAVVAGGGKAISIVSRRFAPRFARGSGPVALAAGSVELTLILRRYSNNEIDAYELREQLTRALVGAGAGLWCGMVGQAVIPVPVVGGLVGSLLGAVVAEAIVDSGLLGSTAASRAADEYLSEIEAAAAIAVAAFDDFESDMQAGLEQHEARMQHLILPALERLNEAHAASDPATELRELMSIGAATGIDVPFHSPEDLHEFGREPGALLAI